MGNAWPSFTAKNADFCKSDGNEPGAQAALAPPPPPPAKAKRKRYVRLENSPQIRREMAKVYRQMQAGEIDAIKGTKLVYVLTEISRTLERENVEKLSERLDEAEGK